MHRIFTTRFSDVCRLYVAKVERKGRSEAELREVINDLLMQGIRYLGKLVDGLAKGRPMEVILRN